MSGASPHIQYAFDSAIREFKANLKNPSRYDEILQTTSIDQVYDFTDQLQKEQAKTGHLRNLAKIQPYLNRLADYTKAIDTFVQAKPDILALIWGPVKLVLQWANVLKQSFDAVVDTFEEIGELLPEFCEMSRIFAGNARLQDILVLFFRDILDFYLVASKFFGSSRLKYMFEALWPRRRDEIQIVVQHVARHRELLRNEVRLEEIREANEARIKELKHFALSEEHYVKQEFASLRVHVSPKDYDAELYRLHGAVCGGTGQWLFRDQSFKAWMDNSQSSRQILWLRGIPGAGKTLLASTIVKHIQAFTQNTLFAFLTYKDQHTTALSVFHSLIFQLASTSHDLRMTMTQTLQANLTTNLEAASGLFQSLLQCAGGVYLIIDGIDEIDSTERSKMLKELLKLRVACEECRILLSSRSESDICALLKDKTIDIQVHQRNSGSIQTYVNSSMEEWCNEKQFLPETKADVLGLLAPLAARAKGMFLYVKLFFGMIKSMDNLDDIHEELEHLPETLDDAYGRIFKRINGSRDSALKSNARKILGWVGCAPSPMTRHELEQALVLNPDRVDQEPRVRSVLDVVKTCGPVLEIVDGYVQFVHFTVKQYVFNPNVRDSLSLPDMTLDLALKCMSYLCQDHYGESLTAQGIEENVVWGAYRLHHFSSLFWLELVERYIEISDKCPIPKCLIDQLWTLHDTRAVTEYQASGHDRYLANATVLALRVQWSELAEFVQQALYFRGECSQADYHVRDSTRWIHLDPLTTSRFSIELHKHFDGVLSCESGIKQLMNYHYGSNVFKCGFLRCQFHRYGFDSMSTRKSHEKYHDKHWKCSIPGCEFATIGFISRKMRDHHLQESHRPSECPKAVEFQNLDFNEIQPLLFDLIEAEEVEVVRALLPLFAKLEPGIQLELATLAASKGSESMFRLLYVDSILERLLAMEFDLDAVNYLYVAVITSGSAELSKLLLGDRGDADPWHWSPIRHQGFTEILQALINLESETIYDLWKPPLRLLFEKIQDRMYMLSHFVSKKVITASANTPTKEHLLLRFWEDFQIAHNGANEPWRRSILNNIAKTTCSINLAEYILRQGWHVDSRVSDNFRSPLHDSALRTGEQSAKFMEFLLLQGANPDLVYKGRKIGKEPGAAGISRWLGVSWDQLVERTRKSRQQQEKMGRNTDLRDNDQNWYM